MSFNPTLSLADIIEFLLIASGIYLVYWKNQKKGDERLLKSETELDSIKSDIKRMETDCTTCKTDMNHRINEVDRRAASQFTEVKQGIAAMEKALRDDIRNLQQNIINVINNK